MGVSKEFTLKYVDGREEHYENYRFYERLSGNEKITRKGNKLYKAGKVFLKKGEDYWVEITPGQDGGTEFTLEFKDGTTESFVGYGHYARLNNENKITRSKGRLYYQGMLFEQVVKDYWVEIDKGTKIKKSNRKTNSKNKTNGTAKFNKIYDSFYLTKDWSVWDFENMQLYFDRDDSEHMELTSCDKRIKTNGKSKRVRRCITYKGTKYYNIDNWRTWVAETPKKPKKEKLNHSNKIPITKFYKEGVWYFTPDKKTKNYRRFLKSNEIYVFSNKYTFWSGALWEKDSKDNVWYYRKEMLRADKVDRYIIPLNEDEYYFKAEIMHLRKIGYKINYRYIKSKRQQPNKRNEEQQVEYMKKVKKMSRADRKKALNKKKKRQGKYRERRGL
jgi:hypothetical protein